MGQIKTGHFEADGAAVNLEIGFIPSYFAVWNLNAAAGEIFKIEWFGNEMDDAAEIKHTVLADNGSTGNLSIDYSSSGGNLADYDTMSASESSNLVTISGFKGVTIAAAFMDDSDEIYYLAIEADKDTDHGDINA